MWSTPLRQVQDVKGCQHKVESRGESMGILWHVLIEVGFICGTEYLQKCLSC